MAKTVFELPTTDWMKKFYGTSDYSAAVSVIEREIDDAGYHLLVEQRSDNVWAASITFPSWQFLKGNTAGVSDTKEKAVVALDYALSITFGEHNGKN